MFTKRHMSVCNSFIHNTPKQKIIQMGSMNKLYSCIATKKKKLLLYRTIWMYFIDILLNKRNQIP